MRFALPLILELSYFSLISVLLSQDLYLFLISYCIQQRDVYYPFSAIKDELSQFIDEMLVPKPMIVAINELEPTEQDFIEQLHELSHKINVVKEQSYKGGSNMVAAPPSF